MNIRVGFRIQAYKHVTCLEKAWCWLYYAFAEVGIF